MNIEDYTAAALKTESKIDTVTINPLLLDNAIKSMIASGNILDMIKKNVFYGRPIDMEAFAQYIDDLHSTACGLLRIEKKVDIDNTKEVLNVDPRIFHGIVGMTTESVELLEALQKGLETGEMDFVNIAEECGDSDWYEAITLDAIGIDWNENMSRNIAKLKKRYEGSFTANQANQRDLIAEREILEDNH